MHDYKRHDLWDWFQPPTDAYCLCLRTADNVIGAGNGTCMTNIGIQKPLLLLLALAMFEHRFWRKRRALSKPQNGGRSLWFLQWAVLQPNNCCIYCHLDISHCLWKCAVCHHLQLSQAIFDHCNELLSFEVNVKLEPSWHTIHQLTFERERLKKLWSFTRHSNLNRYAEKPRSSIHGQ